LNKSAVTISFLSKLNNLFYSVLAGSSFAHPEGSNHDATQLNETNPIIKLAKKPADRVMVYLLLSAKNQWMLCWCSLSRIQVLPIVAIC
jgi:hypothetical protein